MNSPIFYSIADTAKLLGLSEQYIRQGIKNSTIPYLPVGKKKLIHVPKLKAIIDKGNTEQEKNDDV